MRYSRYPVPHALLVDVADTMDRFGRLPLANNPGARAGAAPPSTGRCSRRSSARRRSRRCSAPASTTTPSSCTPSERGRLKQALLKIGWPAEDLAGYVDGAAHPIELDQADWHLRDYQQEAVEGFWAGGSGVVVLPCGAGKTLVGAAAMAEAKATTLILVTNTVAGRQWKRELIARTSLTEEEIGEYSGERKEIRPVTIATYQVITTRRKGEYRHLDLFDAQDWGLIVYDEVHLLPAPIFRHDRRPAVAPPAGPDRDAGARGRPRGRRLLPHRAEAVRRARGATSRRRAGSRRPSASRCGSRSTTRSG